MSIARSEPLSLPGLAWPIELRSHPRARALRLRLDEARGLLTLTCPKRVSRRAALDWALRQSDWVEAQLARIDPPIPFLPGSAIPFQGREIILTWDRSSPRSPMLAGDALNCGGPLEGYSARIERFLRQAARDRLSRATADAARRCGVDVMSVSVGDATTRWGSCTANGALRYNWRLILAPSHLLDWVVAHEVAHRRHMDHGPGFRAVEAELYGRDVSAARAELRALGPRLKRVGRRL